MNVVYNCEICLCSDNLKNYKTLMCGHTFCHDCLYGYLKEKLNSHHVSNIICPQENCKKEMNYYEIVAILPEEEKEKYEKLLLNIMSPIAERNFQCPNCECILIIPPKDQISFIECIKCHRTWCTNEDCMGDWKNHANLTCKKYKEKFMMVNEQKDQELFQNKGWKECPVCKVRIDKINNCNYVRCESVICQKKTLFCYLCGVHLKNEQDIQIHYQGNVYQRCKNFQEERKNLIEEKRILNNGNESSGIDAMHNPSMPNQNKIKMSQRNQNETPTRMQSHNKQDYGQNHRINYDNNIEEDTCCDCLKQQPRSRQEGYRN